jgi:hypothetical protein
MSEFQTVFGSLNDYTKGELKIINDDPKHYVFSNIFDVASKSKPYEKVVVAINLEYVIEAVRAEGVSDWFAVAHDEFAIVMDGEVRIDLVKLDNPNSRGPPDKQGAVKVKGEPVRQEDGLHRLQARPPGPAAGGRRLPLHRDEDRRDDDADGQGRPVRAKVGARSATSNRIIERPDFPYVVARFFWRIESNERSSKRR